MRKALISLFLVACMLLSAPYPVFAADEPFPEDIEPIAATEDITAEESALVIEAADEPEGEDAADPAVQDEAPLEDDEAMPPALDGTYQDQEKAIAAKIITAGMSDLDKLYTITKYAADNFNYSSISSNGTAETLFTQGAGNCYANSYFIIDLCKLVGVNAWLRSAGRDKNASSTHVDVVALIDGKYYTAGAGSAGTKPRYFSVWEIPGGFTVEDGVLYQYDGINTPDIVIPSRSPDAYYHTRTKESYKSGMTITQIGYSGEQCFSYGGATGLRSITLPSTVKTVTATAFKGCKDLENIYVDSDNPYFTSIDGVLYSKDLTRLVCVPAKKTSVTIPSTVTTQDKDAFYGGKIPVYVYSSTATPFTDVTDQWFAESVRFVYAHSLFKGTSNTTFSPNSTMTRGMFITVLGRFEGCASALGSWSGTLGISNASGVSVRNDTTTSGTKVLASIASPGEAVKVLSTVQQGKDGAVWYQVQYNGVTGYVRQKSTASSGKTLLYVYTGEFTDLPAGSYYTGYAQWANIFGIMQGVSSTEFRPSQNIKREDICVLLYRYLTDYLGYSISGGGSAFDDDASISSYARDAVYAMRQIGVVNGYPDNTFRPRAFATRAEVATMFRSLSTYMNK